MSIPYIPLRHQSRLPLPVNGPSQTNGEQQSTDHADAVSPFISYAGEVVDPENFRNPEKSKLFDVGAFLARHTKDKRGPEVFAAAKALKQELGYKKVGAVGFCYGGWAVFQLAAKGGFDI